MHLQNPFAFTVIPLHHWWTFHSFWKSSVNAWHISMRGKKGQNACGHCGCRILCGCFSSVIKNSDRSRKKTVENQGISSEVCTCTFTHTQTHSAVLSFLACYGFCAAPNFWGNTSKGVALFCSFSLFTDVSSFLNPTLSKWY